jgi:hypothetical protein
MRQGYLNAIHDASFVVKSGTLCARPEKPPCKGGKLASLGRIRRFRADLESTSAADLVDVADALGEQYPDMTRAEQLQAAHELFKEIARRLRSGQAISFIKKNENGTWDINLAYIEELPNSSLAKRT